VVDPLAALAQCSAMTGGPRVISTATDGGCLRIRDVEPAQHVAARQHKTP
jgi:hypothetical protein